MDPVFPLQDVEIKRVEKPRQVQNPDYANSWMSLNEREFFMEVKDVGRFYACDGRYIEFAPEPGAATPTIELYLNGSVYGAILHQRKILPLHGSSFVYNTKGVMLCGDSGAGKSSLTVSFCDSGAQFLTDDVSPVQLIDGIPHVVPKSDRVKLWDDSLTQLEKQDERLAQIRPEDEKFYLRMVHEGLTTHPLHIIFVMEVSGTDGVLYEPVSGTASFSVIHEQIYRLYYLNVMPEALKTYVATVAAISTHCRIVKVKRPREIPIKQMRTELENYMIEVVS